MDGEESATLNVAGDLVDEWSALLERECLRRLETVRELRLDLSDVTLVDDTGVGTLRRLKDRGVRIARCSRLIADLIEECGD